MKRDIELYLTRKKGKRPKIKVYDCSKGQRLSHQREISKGILTMRCNSVKRSKRSNDGVKCKAPS